MIRIKISFAIIAAIIVLGISGFFVLRHETLEVMDYLDQTRELADSGRKTEALESADRLLGDWDKFHTYASIFITNDKISDAQESISRIRALIETDNDELDAEFDTAEVALNWIIEGEIPRLTNIL